MQSAHWEDDLTDGDEECGFAEAQEDTGARLDIQYEEGVMDQPESFRPVNRIAYPINELGRFHQNVHRPKNGSRELLPSESRAEVVVGRDWIVTPEFLSTGIDLYDNGTGGSLFLSSVFIGPHLVHDDDLGQFVEAVLSRFYNGSLKAERAARAAAGPLDVRKFLRDPSVKAKVDAAITRRQNRKGVSRKRSEDLRHVIHVNPRGRSCYIGDEHDLTRNGKAIMEFEKSYMAEPIRSWTGGWKMADLGGKRGSKLVRGKLSKVMQNEEPRFIQWMNRIWDVFSANPATKEAAAWMKASLLANQETSVTQLGRTGWNAYSFNLDFSTAPHFDGKNVPGSFSALVVLETGKAFAGCHYLLPQIHMAMDVRQGNVVFHRSGDAFIGLHANSKLWLPEKGSHRIAIILYQTQIKANNDNNNNNNNNNEPHY